MGNPWMDHVKTVRKANPGKSLKEVLKMAGKTYKKQGTSVAKKSKKARKGSRKARKGTRKVRRKRSRRHRGGTGGVQGTNTGNGTDSFASA